MASTKLFAVPSHQHSTAFPHVRRVMRSSHPDGFDQGRLMVVLEWRDPPIKQKR